MGICSHAERLRGLFHSLFGTLTIIQGVIIIIIIIHIMIVVVVVIIRRLWLHHLECRVLVLVAGQHCIR